MKAFLKRILRIDTDYFSMEWDDVRTQAELDFLSVQS